MLNRSFLTGMAVMIAAGTLAYAQAPSGRQLPAGHEPATAEKPATITLAGCLVREGEVPGRKPNIVERVGILEERSQQFTVDS